MWVGAVQAPGRCSKDRQAWSEAGGDPGWFRGGMGGFARRSGREEKRGVVRWKERVAANGSVAESGRESPTHPCDADEGWHNSGLPVYDSLPIVCVEDRRT